MQARKAGENEGEKKEVESERKVDRWNGGKTKRWKGQGSESAQVETSRRAKHAYLVD